MGRSARTIWGPSDSRERALGDVENRLEHSKGDLRKSRSHPRSLAVPGGPTSSACPAPYRGLAAKHPPPCTSCPPQRCRFLPRGLAGPAGPAPSPQAVRAKPRPRRWTLLTVSSSSTGRKGAAAANVFRKGEGNFTSFFLKEVCPEPKPCQQSGELPGWVYGRSFDAFRLRNVAC